MSAKVLVVANTAGGSGKTTLAHGLAVAMTEFGKKTLVIDLDPRAGLTFRLGRENQRLSIADFLSGTSVRSEDLESLVERFDFIGADSRVGFGFTSDDLKRVLATLPKDYDLVIIDTPSDINAGLQAALHCADLVLIPYSQSLHQMRGVAQVKSLAGEAIQRLIQIGDDSQHASECLAWEHLDSRCSHSDEVESAATGVTSVLTFAKNSKIASEIRECAYSALELLGLD